MTRRLETKQGSKAKLRDNNSVVTNKSRSLEVPPQLIYPYNSHKVRQNKHTFSSPMRGVNHYKKLDLDLKRDLLIGADEAQLSILQVIELHLSLSLLATSAVLFLRKNQLLGRSVERLLAKVSERDYWPGV